MGEDRLTSEEAEGLQFLQHHLPPGDREGLSAADLIENVRLAYAVRHETPCGMTVPEEIFREYVLPHRFLDETPCAWRKELHTRFAETARRAASIEDAVSTLNRVVFEEFGVTFHATKRPHDNMNPHECRAWGFASCTGLSILLAAACRAVGIPARLVGTPMWADGSGNHTWIEVWDHGTWHFLGASEPGRYDLCWFNDRARTARVYAARYSPGRCEFPLAWTSKRDAVPADEVTARYRTCADTPDDATSIVTEPRRYLAPRVEGPLELTGRMDDPCWAHAPWTEDFVDIEGHRKPTPRFRTRARICWDSEYLYVGAEMEDPHVWGTLTEKNAVIFNDPDFEVFIDPDGDNHDYYEFEINALGTIWELWLERPYRDGGPIHRAHNLDGVRYAVAIDGTLNDPTDTDQGWSVEIAFPWASLRRFAGERACPPRDGDQWRVNFSRVQWLVDIIDGAYRKVPRAVYPEDNWVWSPQGAIDMHRPETWGYVEFAIDPAEERQVRRDELWPARELLMDLYAQQRDREVPSASLDDFELRGVRAPALRDLRIEVDGEGWRASVACANRTLAVDNEGRLTIRRAVQSPSRDDPV